MSRKPASLTGFTSDKGKAVPPTDQPQRAAASVETVEPDNEVHGEPRSSAGEPPIVVPTKSLTVKISLPEYRRLRTLALDGRTHQDIASTALSEYLDKHLAK